MSAQAPLGMALSALLLPLGLQHDGARDPIIASIAFDARRVRPGALFVAWAGKSADGHDHLAAAIDRGAVAALCARPVAARVPVVVVPEPRRLLGPLGQILCGHPAESMALVGITGTAGKTTCAHLCAAILAAWRGEAGLLGTLGAARMRRGAPGPQGAGFATGSPLTTPEGNELAATLGAWRDDQVLAAALEASSIALVQGRLDGVHCDVALMTSFGREHLDFHGTMPRYLAAKARLFDHHLKPHGVAVLNADDPQQDSLAAHAPQVLRYSIHAPAQQRRPAEVYVAQAQLRADGTDMLVHAGGELWPMAARLVGPFNLSNLIACVAVGVALGIPLPTIAQGLMALEQVGGRLERVTLPGAIGPLVLVDYAHKPAALEAALQAARALCRGRLFVVFGCGGERDVGKRAEMGTIAARLADVIVVTDDNPRGEAPTAIAEAIVSGLRAGKATKHPLASLPLPCAACFDVELDRASAIAMAVRHAGCGDVVLIAGKGHETYQERAGRKIPFDDRAVAREALRCVHSQR